MDFSQSLSEWVKDKPLSILQLDPADRAVLKIADERDAIQKKTFTKWVNKHLKKHWRYIEGSRHIDDLFEDIRDGHNLLSLLEVLSGEMLPREKGRLRFHMLQNVQTALDFLKYKKIRLVNIRPEDIVDGNPKLTLGLIWTIILHFQFVSYSELSMQSSSSSSKRYVRVTRGDPQMSRQLVQELESGDVVPVFHSRTQVSSKDSEDVYRAGENRGGVRTVHTTRVVKHVTTTSHGENKTVTETVVSSSGGEDTSPPVSAVIESSPEVRTVTRTTTKVVKQSGGPSGEKVERTVSHSSSGPKVERTVTHSSSGSSGPKIERVVTHSSSGSSGPKVERTVTHSSSGSSGPKIERTVTHSSSSSLGSKVERSVTHGGSGSIGQKVERMVSETGGSGASHKERSVTHSAGGSDGSTYAQKIERTVTHSARGSAVSGSPGEKVDRTIVQSGSSSTVTERSVTKKSPTKETEKSVRKVVKKSSGLPDVERKTTKISDIITGVTDQSVTAREALLRWAQHTTERYPGVRVTDFTTTWKDGLAFNAIIHRNRPDLLDFRSLRTRSAKENLENAFSLAEKEFGVTRLLDPEDVDTPEPDEKSIITYISSLYDAFPNPPVHHPFLEEERHHKVETYKDLAIKLQMWLLESTSMMRNRQFPNSVLEVKALLTECSKFSNEEVPKHLEEKKRIFNLHSEIEKLSKEFGKVIFEGDLKLDSIDKKWNQMLTALHDREQALKEELLRLEKLQKVAEKVCKEAKLCEGKLEDAEKHIKEVQKRTQKVHSADVKQISDSFETSIKNSEDIVQSMKKDIKRLFDNNYCQANELEKRMVDLAERCTTLRASWQAAIFVSSPGKPVKMDERDSIKQVPSNEQISSETNRSFSYLKEHLDWVEKKLKKLQVIEVGQDVSSIKSALDQHKQEHKSIEQYKKKIDQCSARKNTYSGDSYSAFCETLALLQTSFANLLEFSSQKLNDLQTLLDFAQSAAKELKWMAEKEETEVTRDWSAKNLNLSEIERYQEVLTNDLEKKEVQLTCIQRKGENLLAGNHLVSKCIESYLISLQNQWSLLLQLALCLEVHLKNALSSSQFHKEVRECEQYLKRTEEKLNTTFSKTVVTADEGEKCLKQIRILRDELSSHGEKIFSLVECSKNIVNFKQRRQPVNKPVRLTALCCYKDSKITIGKDECWMLLDNTVRTRWKVTDNKGQEAVIPSVCFLIPPPNHEAIELAESLKKKYDSVLSVWSSKERKIRQNLILATVKVVKSWDVAQFCGMESSQRESIIHALNEDLQKLLTESSDDDVMLQKLKQEMESCNQLVESLAEKAVSEEKGKSQKPIVKKLLDNISSLQTELTGKEKALKSKLSQPISWKIAFVEGLVIEHKEFEMSMRALEDRVEEIKKLYISLTTKAAPVHSKYDALVSSWDKVWELSNSYVERLKAVELAVNGFTEATQIVSSFEVQLASFEKLPSDIDALRQTHDKLLALQSELQRQQHTIDYVSESLSNVKNLIHSTRPKQAVHSDLTKFETDVKKLNARWNDVSSQIVERLRSCGAASELITAYKNKVEEDKTWISETSIKMNSMKTVRSMTTKEVEIHIEPVMNLYSSISDQSSSFEHTNVLGARFIREAKIYDLRLKHYKENLEEEHPSLDACLQKQSRVVCGADSIADELDHLNLQYQRLLETVLLYVEELKTSFAERSSEKLANIISKALPLSLRTFRTAIDPAPALESEAQNYKYSLNYEDAFPYIAAASCQETSLTVKEVDHCIEGGELKEPIGNYKDMTASIFPNFSDETTPEEDIIYLSKAVVNLKSLQKLTLHDSVKEGIVDIHNGEYTDSRTGCKMTLLDAAKRNFISPLFYERITAKCNIFYPGIKKELSLLEAMQNNLYDISEGTFVNPQDGTWITPIEAFHLGILKHSGIKTVVEMGFIKAFNLSLTEAVKNEFLNPKTGMFQDPLTGASMNFRTAVDKGYIVIPDSGTEDLGMSLAEALDKGIIDEQRGFLRDQSSGEIIPLDEAMSRKIIHSGHIEIFDSSAARMLSLQDAILKGIIDVHQGKFIDRKFNSYLTLYEAYQKKLIYRPLSLKEACDQNLVDSEGTISSPLTSEKLSIISALAKGILSLNRKCIVHPETDELLSLPEALKQGVILPEGEYFDSVKGLKLPIVNAEKAGYLVPVPSRFSEATGVINVASGEYISVSDAVDQGILDVNKGQFIDNLSHTSMNLERAVQLKLIKPEVYEMLLQPTGIHHGVSGKESAGTGDIQMGISDSFYCHLEGEKGKLSLTEVLPESAMQKADGSVVSKEYDNKQIAESRLVLPNEYVGEYIPVADTADSCDGSEEKELVLLRHYDITEHERTQDSDTVDDFFPKGVKKAGNSAAESHISRFSAENYAEECAVLDIVNSVVETKNLADTSHKGTHISDQHAYSKSSVSVSTVILELPQNGWFLNEAIGERLFDANTGYFIVPATKEQLSLEEAVKKRVINAGSAVVVDPKSTELISLISALESDCLDSTGHYLAAEGKITFAEAIDKRYVILANRHDLITTANIDVGTCELFEICHDVYYDTKQSEVIVKSTGEHMNLITSVQAGKIDASSFRVKIPNSEETVTLVDAFEKQVVDPVTGDYLSKSEEIVHVPFVEAIRRGYIVHANLKDTGCSTADYIPCDEVKSEISHHSKNLGQAEIIGYIEEGVIERSGYIYEPQAALVDRPKNEAPVVLQKVHRLAIPLKEAAEKGLVDDETAAAVLRFMKSSENDVPVSLEEAVEKGLIDGTGGEFFDVKKGKSICIKDAMQQNLIDSQMGAVLIPVGRPLCLPEAAEQSLVDPGTNSIIHPETGLLLNIADAMLCDIINPLSQLVHPVTEHTVTLQEAVSEGIIDAFRNKVVVLGKELDIVDALNETNIFKSAGTTSSKLPPLAPTLPVVAERKLFDPLDSKYMNLLTKEKMSLETAVEKNMVMVIPKPKLPNSISLKEALEKGLLNLEEKTFRHPDLESVFTIREAVECGILLVKSDRSGVAVCSSTVTASKEPMTAASPDENEVEGVICQKYFQINEIHKRASDSIKYKYIKNAPLNVSDALRSGKLHLESGMFTDPSSDVCLPVSDAVKLKLVDPFDKNIQSGESRKYSINDIFKRFFDSESNSFLIPDYDKPLSFKSVVADKLLDLQCVVHETDKKRSMSLNDALESGKIDIDIGTYFDHNTGLHLSVKEAAEQGLLLVFGVEYTSACAEQKEFSSSVSKSAICVHAEDFDEVSALRQSEIERVSESNIGLLQSQQAVMLPEKDDPGIATITSSVSINVDTEGNMDSKETETSSQQWVQAASYKASKVGAVTELTVTTPEEYLVETPSVLSASKQSAMEIRKISGVLETASESGTFTSEMGMMKHVHNNIQNGEVWNIVREETELTQQSAVHSLCDDECASINDMEEPSAGRYVSEDNQKKFESVLKDKSSEKKTIDSKDSRLESSKMFPEMLPISTSSVKTEFCLAESIPSSAEKNSVNAEANFAEVTVKPVDFTFSDETLQQRSELIITHSFDSKVVPSHDSPVISSELYHDANAKFPNTGDKDVSIKLHSSQEILISSLNYADVQNRAEERADISKTADSLHSGGAAEEQLVAESSTYIPESHLDLECFGTITEHVTETQFPSGNGSSESAEAATDLRSLKPAELSAFLGPFSDSKIHVESQEVSVSVCSHSDSLEDNSLSVSMLEQKPEIVSYEMSSDVPNVLPSSDLSEKGDYPKHADGVESFSSKPIDDKVQSSSLKLDDFKYVDQNSLLKCSVQIDQKEEMPVVEEMPRVVGQAEAADEISGESYAVDELSIFMPEPEKVSSMTSTTVQYKLPKTGSPIEWKINDTGNHKANLQNIMSRTKDLSSNILCEQEAFGAQEPVNAYTEDVKKESTTSHANIISNLSSEIQVKVMSLQKALQKGLILPDICCLVIGSKKVNLVKALSENMVDLQAVISIVNDDEIVLVNEEMKHTDEDTTSVFLSSATEKSYKTCKENTAKLLSWLDEKEACLSNMGFVKEELASLQHQLNTTKGLKDELISQQQMVNTCLDQVRQLVHQGLEVLSKSEVQELQKNLQTVKRRYEILINECDRLLRRLVGALEELQKFKTELNAFREWILNAEKEYGKKEKLLMNLSKLDENFVEYRKFSSDVIAHQADLRFITMAAQKFSDESKDYLKILNMFRTNLPECLPHIEPVEGEIKCEVQEVSSAYHSLLNNVNRLSDYFSITCTKYRYYHDSHDKASQWLSSAKKVAKRILDEVVSAEPAGLQDQLDYAKTFNMEVVGQGRLIEHTEQAARALTDFLESTGVKSTEVESIERSVNKLNKEYSEIANAVTQKIKDLQTVLLHSQDIQDGLDRFLKWLDETDAALHTHTRPVSLISEKLEEQIQEFKILQSDVSNQKQSIETIKASAKELMNSNPKSAKKVETKVKDISSRFDKLCEQISRRKNFLEEILSSVRTFDTIAIQFEEWITSAMERIESRDITQQVDVDGFTSVIEFTLNQRNAKQDEYDKMVKLGKNLALKQDVTDVTYFKDRLKSLEQQWKNLESTLHEKQKLGKAKSQQLAEYEVLRCKILEYLSKMEVTVECLEPLSLDMSTLKKQLSDIKPLMKEHSEYGSSLDKLNSLASVYETVTKGESLRRKPSSPVRKQPSPTSKSPSKIKSPDSIPTSPTKSQVTTQSPLSTASSGFSSRSSTENFTGIDDLNPVQQQLAEINHRYGLLGSKLTDLTEEIKHLTSELKSFSESLKTAKIFIEGKEKQLPKKGLPASKEQADKHIEVVKAIQEEMIEKQSELDNILSQGKEILKKKPDVKGSSELLQEIKILEDNWSCLWASVKSSLVFLQDYKEFHDAQVLLCSWLSQREKMFQVLGPIASEPRLVSSQIQQVQVMKDEFSSQKLLLDRLDQCGKAIVEHMSLANASAKKVTEQMENIHCIWDGLVGRLEERDKNLAAASGIAGEFHKIYAELHDRLQKINDSFDQLADFNGSLSEQLKRLVALEDQLEKQRPLLTDADSSCEKLCEILSDSASKSDIRNKTNSLERSYTNLTKKITNRKAEIESSVKEDREFYKTCENMQEWLNKTEKTLPDMKISANINTLRKQVADYEPQYKAVMDKEHELHLLLNKGSDMLEKVQIKHEHNALKTKLEEMQKQWQKIKKKTLDRHTKLQCCLDNCQKYFMSTETFMPWLEISDAKVNSLKVTSFQRSVISKQIKDIQSAKNDVTKHIQEYENIQSLGNVLLTECVTDKEVVQTQMENMKKMWDHLNQGITSRSQLFEDLLQKVIEYQDKLREVQHSVQRLEDKLSSHEALGSITCDVVLLERLKSLRKEATDLSKQLENVKQFTKLLLSKAGASADSSEVQKDLETVEKKLMKLTETLSDRCTNLATATKVIAQYTDQVKSVQTELDSLDKSFSSMMPVARDKKVLQQQIKEVQVFISQISKVEQSFKVLENRSREIVSQGYVSDAKSYNEQLAGLQKHILHLEEQAKGRLMSLESVLTSINKFYESYHTTRKEMEKVTKEEQTFKMLGGDVDSVRAQQQAFKEFRTVQIQPLSVMVENCRKISKSIMLSAPADVSTCELETDLEMLSETWNSLQERVNEREKRLDEALLQSGKFQEALFSVEKWLKDIEEMVQNQKPPSADFKVVKAQIQEQKFLQKMLLDRQNSVMSLKESGTEIMQHSVTKREKEQVDGQMVTIIKRFEELRASAEERMALLEKTIPVAQELQTTLSPLSEWIEQTEKCIAAILTIPVDSERVKEKIKEHKDLHDDIVKHKKQIEKVTAITEKLKQLIGDDEAQAVQAKVNSIARKFSEVLELSSNISKELHKAEKGVIMFTEKYERVVTWVEKTTTHLTSFKVLSVYLDKLEEQIKSLKKLKTSVDKESSSIETVLSSGQDIMKVASGEDTIHMKEKLDMLNMKFAELASRLDEKLKASEDALPLVKSFYESNSKLTGWIDSAERLMKTLDSHALNNQQSAIQKLKSEMQEFRSLLETVNHVGPRICQLCPGDGAAQIENTMSKTNHRFDALSESVQRRAERIELAVQRKFDVVGDIEELIEWFTDIHKQIREVEGLSPEPNSLSAMLKQQKRINDDINSQKGRIRDILSAAKKLMRESSAEDLSFIREKSEKLKNISNDISAASQDRLSVIEQALPLAEHFFETHSDLGQWLDSAENEAQLLEAPALNVVQIKKQQDRNKGLVQSVHEHKPLVDKLNKTGSALTKLCREDETEKVETILESDNSRYNALRKILREHQSALEEALQATAQFSDKLEGMLNALSSTADQINNAEPISAHPERIQEQINDNKAVLQDLEKRTSALEAVKRAADDVIVKASSIDEPAVRDIKKKLDHLNYLWDTIQTAAYNRGKSLEEALIAAEKFWDELTAVMKALKELQDNLNNQETPAVEPSAVQEQQEVLQEIKQEISQTKPEVDHCRQAGQDLMQLCGEPDKPEVKKHIEDLDSVWENVTTLYAKREQNLIDAMEKAMTFHNTLQNLLEFLDGAEEKFSDLGAVSNDIGVVKKQVAELKNFKAEVDPHMVEVESLNRQAQELVERTSPDQAMAIREPLSDINKRWDDLLKGIVDRQQEMENILLKLGQFHHSLEELVIWISKTENALDELKPVFGDPQVIEVVLAKHKVLANDIQAHESSIEAIIRAGSQLSEGMDATEDAKSAQNKLLGLTTRWQQLQDKSSERQRELQEALKEALQFHQEIQDLLMWLSDIDGQLVTSKPVGGLPETAKEQLNRFMDLYNELDANRHKIENVLQQGKNYSKRSGEDSTKKLQHSLHALRQRWENVQTKANDRKIKLEIALREATEFHEALDTFVGWLTSAEKYLTSLKPVSRCMKTVLEQIEDHRNFQKDIGSHREIMLNLDKKGTHLKYFSQKQDVILIKNLLISVQHRWERVVSKAAERTRLLDHGYKEAKEFHDSWTTMSNWLDEAEKTLDSITHIGNDPFKIKQLLAKHKEFQRVLGSKQTSFDSTMRLGRSLKDKCQKYDVQALQGMMDDLKTRWNRVCSKSVDRQRKLEEALLYSGQFKEAVQALVDWLDKSFSKLSDVKNWYGDIDTVTTLVEKHKTFQAELKDRGVSLESLRKTASELKESSSPEDANQISSEIEAVELKWLKVVELSDDYRSKLDEAFQKAEKLHKSVHMLLEWLSDAEMKLRFAGPLPEDEKTTEAQITAHQEFLKEMEKQEVNKDEILELAQFILKKCHPDGVSVIKHWITIIQSRWEEVALWAKQRDQRLHEHLQSLRNILELLEELLSWLMKAENTLTSLEAEPLPDDLLVLEHLIKEHQEFMDEMSKKQPDVEKISKALSWKKDGSHSVPQGATKEKSSREKPSRGTPLGPLKASTPLKQQGESDIKHPRARLLLEKWRHVWLLAMERQRRLQDKYNYLRELEKIKNFDFEEWRRRYLHWTNNKKSRIMDQFKKIDKSNSGKVTKQEFIDGILRSKFQTSRLEMERVVDVFDINGDGFIDTREYIDTLRPEKEGQPKTEAEKIEDEVQRQVAKCTCVHRFKVYQVGEGKYRFGDSQKLRLVRILRSTVMVRVGGGWVALDEFLVKNDPCRAKGRTNLELREQFILAEGVSQSMAPFKPKPSPNSSVSSQSGTSFARSGNSIPSAGPITKVREKSERSTPMHQSRSSADTSSDVSGPSLSEAESFSSKSGMSRLTPTRISSKSAGSKSGSRPSSRPSSRAASDLSQDGVDCYKSGRKSTSNNLPHNSSVPTKHSGSKIPSAKQASKASERLGNQTGQKKEAKSK